MFSSFWWNRSCAVWAWGGAIFLLSIMSIQVDFSVQMNAWNGRFYDLMQDALKKHHEASEFWDLMKAYGILVLKIMVVGTTSSYATRMYCFKWREMMTFEYVRYWRGCEGEIEGSSQRIQEDCYRFARIMESLGISFIRSMMTLGAFIPVLWTLGKGVKLPIVGDIDGSLVWFSIIVSVGGFIITWFVGWYLPTLEYNNQKVEAAFRKELVYGEDDKIHHAEPETLIDLFKAVKRNYHRLFLHRAYFNLWRYFYNQSISIVPYLAVGPSVFAGTVTLGVMMQISNAFGRVRGSFGFLMNNWMTITELRSIWRRLHEFERNIHYKEQKLALKQARAAEKISKDAQ